MSAVVGLLILFPFTGQTKNDKSDEGSHVSTVTPDKHAPVETSPIDTPGTDEYHYSELARGMK